MKPKLRYHLLALTFDLIFAGILLILLISRYSPFNLYTAPTSAELGYAVGSNIVRNEQVKLILLSFLTWIGYIVLSTLSFQRTLGQKFVGLFYQDESIIKNYFPLCCHQPLSLIKYLEQIF
jgi:hypothetical protein